MPQDEISLLYKALKSDNYDLPDEAAFRDNLNEPDQAELLHKAMISDNYELPEFNEFYSNLSLSGGSVEKKNPTDIGPGGEELSDGPTTDIAEPTTPSEVDQPMSEEPVSEAPVDANQPNFDIDLGIATGSTGGGIEQLELPQQPQSIPEQADATFDVDRQEYDQAELRKQGDTIESDRVTKSKDKRASDITSEVKNLDTNPFYMDFYDDKINHKPVNKVSHDSFVKSQESVPVLMAEYKVLQEKIKDDLLMTTEGLFEVPEDFESNQQEMAERVLEIEEELNLTASHLSDARETYKDPFLGMTDDQRKQAVASDIVNQKYKSERLKLMDNFGQDKKEGVKALDLSDSDKKKVGDEIKVSFKDWLDDLVDKDIDKWYASIGKTELELLEMYMNETLYPQVRNDISGYNPKVLKKILNINKGIDSELDVGIERDSETSTSRSQLDDNLKKMIVLSSMVDYGYDPSDYFGWDDEGVKLDPSRGFTVDAVDQVVSGLGSGLYTGVIETGANLLGMDAPLSENMMGMDLLQKGSVVPAMRDVFNKSGVEMPEEVKEWTEATITDKVQSAMHSTANMIPKFAVGSRMFGAAGSLAAKTAGVDGNIAAFMQAMQKSAKSSNMLTRLTAKAALKGIDITKTGLMYEGTGWAFDEKEGDFASGASGKLGSDAMISLIEKIMPGKMGPAMKAIVGSIGAGAAETTEETLQTLVQAKDLAEFKKQFEGEDKWIFIATTFLMGAVMKGASGDVSTEWSMKEYENLSDRGKKVFDDLTGRTEMGNNIIEADKDTETVGDQIFDKTDAEATQAIKAQLAPEEETGGGPMGMESSANQEAESLDGNSEESQAPTEESLDTRTIGESIGLMGERDGEKGVVMKEGERVIFETPERIYELGSVEELSKKNISEIGVKLGSDVSVNEFGDVSVRGKEYKNKNSDPIQAITKDEDGNIVSVSLDAEDGTKRTFRGQTAEDVAYNIHSHQLFDRPDFNEFTDRNEQAIDREIQETASEETATTDGAIPSADKTRVTKSDPGTTTSKSDPKTTTDSKVDSEKTDKSTQISEAQAAVDDVKARIKDRKNNPPVDESTSEPTAAENEVERLSSEIKKLESKSPIKNYFKGLVNEESNKAATAKHIEDSKTELKKQESIVAKEKKKKSDSKKKSDLDELTNELRIAEEYVREAKGEGTNLVEVGDRPITNEGYGKGTYLTDEDYIDYLDNKVAQSEANVADKGKGDLTAKADLDYITKKRKDFLKDKKAKEAKEAESAKKVKVDEDPETDKESDSEESFFEEEVFGTEKKADVKEESTKKDSKKDKEKEPVSKKIKKGFTAASKALDSMLISVVSSTDKAVNRERAKAKLKAIKKDLKESEVKQHKKNLSIFIRKTLKDGILTPKDANALISSVNKTTNTKSFLEERDKVMEIVEKSQAHKQELKLAETQRALGDQLKQSEVKQHKRDLRLFIKEAGKGGLLTSTDSDRLLSAVDKTNSPESFVEQRAKVIDVLAKAQRQADTTKAKLAKEISKRMAQSLNQAQVKEVQKELQRFLKKAIPPNLRIKGTVANKLISAITKATDYDSLMKQRDAVMALLSKEMKVNIMAKMKSKKPKKSTTDNEIYNEINNIIDSMSEKEHSVEDYINALAQVEHLKSQNRESVKAAKQNASDTKKANVEQANAQFDAKKKQKSQSRSETAANKEAASNDRTIGNLKTGMKNILSIASDLDNGLKGVFKSLFHERLSVNDLEKKYDTEYSFVDKLQAGLKGIDLGALSSTLFGRNKKFLGITFGKVKHTTYSVTDKDGWESEIELTPANEISVYLHSMSEDNRKAILSGGLAWDADQANSFFFTEEQLMEIQNKIEADPDTVKAVKAIRETNDLIYEKINEVYFRMKGMNLPKLENYFGKRVNSLSTSKSPSEALISADGDSVSFNDSQTLQSLGMTLFRVDSSKGLVLEDAFAATMRAAEGAAKYVGQVESLKEAVDLINDPRVKNGLAKTHKKDVVRYLNNYLNNIAGSSPRETTIGGTKIFKFIRIGTIYTYLSANLAVVAKQGPSFILAAKEIPLRYLIQAALPGGNISEKQASEISALLRKRFEGFFNKEMGDIMAKKKAQLMLSGKTKIKNPKDVIELLMIGIGMADSKTVRIVLKAAELELRNTKYKGQDVSVKNPTPEFTEDLKNRVNMVVDKTQPTYDPETRSDWGRSETEWYKTLTMFSTQRNKIANMLYQSHVNKDESATAAWTVAITSAAMIAAIDEFRDHMNNDDEDEDKDNKDSQFIKTTKSIGKRSLYNMLSLAYFGETASAGFQGLFDPEERLFDDSNPYISMLSASKTLLNSVGKTGSDVGEDKDKSIFTNSEKKQIIKDVMHVSSVATKVPFKRLAGYYETISGFDLTKSLDVEKKKKSRSKKSKPIGKSSMGNKFKGLGNGFGKPLGK